MSPERRQSGNDVDGRAPPPRPARRRASLRAELADGLRWLAGHHLLRTLAIVAAIQSLALTAWSSILVLFAQDRFGLSNAGSYHSGDRGCPCEQDEHDE